MEREKLLEFASAEGQVRREGSTDIIIIAILQIISVFGSYVTFVGYQTNFETEYN